MRLFQICLAAIFLVSLPAFPQVILVPEDYPSIQAGIDAAIDGDTVLVAEDNYAEAIDFKGRAITVASHFLIDGDTSHISRTVIDASSLERPVSVVQLVSGEDTASILAGFTITGGSAPKGSGILVMGSGGKILSNIIEENHYSGIGKDGEGAGILAEVHHHHWLIIRNNVVRNNSLSVSDAYSTNGGGMFLTGGAFIVEGNKVINNLSENITGWGVAGGIQWGSWGYEGIIDTSIIRNNIVIGNRAVSNYPSYGIGGGMMLGHAFDEGTALAYNNTIQDNYTSGSGGGFVVFDTRAWVYNNIISGNEAGVNGGGVAFSYANAVFSNNTVYDNKSTASRGHSAWFGRITDTDYLDFVIFNNIFWSDKDGEGSDFHFDAVDTYSVDFQNNILQEWPVAHENLSYKNNTFLPPYLDSAYRNLETSLAIGRGADSVLAKNTWYRAPLLDFSDLPRPDGLDSLVDLGAHESGFGMVGFSSADLVGFSVSGFSLEPSFHPDTLQYALAFIDDIVSVPGVEAIPLDPMSRVDVDEALDAFSEDPAERTKRFTVMSSDESTEKIYQVEYTPLSTDHSLLSMEVEDYTLDPPFDPEIKSYKVNVSDTCSFAPAVSAMATAEDSEVKIYDASFEDDVHMTTQVVVTPAAGRQYNGTYKVLFTRIVGKGSDIPEKSLWSIFPNPVSGMLWVQAGQTGSARIEIMSMNGKLLFGERAEKGYLEIDLSAFQKGIYLITIRSKDLIATRKVIKL